MMPIRTILVLVLAAAGWLGQDTPKPASATSPTLESARKRWERFSPEEKARARTRYERFLAMTEEEREQLVESARQLHERSERVQKELGQTDGERLATMEPAKRRELVHEIVAEESRAVGARIRGQFPESWLARLENATQEERARAFLEFRVHQRDRVARYAIGELGRHLALPAEEIRRLQELPGNERCDAVLDLRKRLSAQEVDESGLPPGLTREQWDAWLALPPEQFFDTFQRYRESRIFAQGKREAVRALFEAARPHPERVLALADLPADERRAKLTAERRERCVHALRDGNLLAAEEIEALTRSSDAEFFLAVRRVLRSAGSPKR
ncbi:MAG TPA: hypothetical protein VGR31_04880 [Planctomycetota bacterium]|jgi:hypothetical protein|nr:hypothetical protein [Planctomycetota bacterium]